MALLRRGPDGKVVIAYDDYVRIDSVRDVTPDLKALVPWELYSQEPTAFAGTSALGVRVPNDVDLARLAPELSQLALVAIEFPSFGDGRGYSIARLLRERHHFEGEVRAVGDVLRDQLLYMSRCGFDAFELASGRSPEDALRAFDEFDEFYQPAVDSKLPLWKRHARSHAK